GPFALNGPKLGPTTHGRLTRLWPFERAGPRTGKTAQEVTGKCPRPSRALRCHEPRAPARILGCHLGPGNHISLPMPRLPKDTTPRPRPSRGKSGKPPAPPVEGSSGTPETKRSAKAMGAPQAPFLPSLPGAAAAEPGVQEGLVAAVPGSAEPDLSAAGPVAGKSTLPALRQVGPPSRSLSDMTASLN